MSLKRRFSTSPSPPPDDSDSNPTTPSTISPQSRLCLICGDKARIINYGTLSCQSCKTFFRRNGFRPEIVRPCPYDQNCQVNMQTRHNCTACRLNKCFVMGMSSDLIRKEERKKAKISPSNTSDTPPSISSQQITTASSLLLSTDLHQDRREELSNLELTLLSNILHAYDTYSIDTRVCRAIDSLSRASNENHIDVLNPLELISQIFTSIQSFLCALPDFRILTTDEQTSLVQRNLHGIIGFYFVLFSRNTKLLDHVQIFEVFTNFYGLETISSVKDAINRLDPDSTLIKVLIVILAFSSHCLMVDRNSDSTWDGLLYGTFRLFGSQNVYLDLLWKYMISQYGYNNSTLRFSRLMDMILCVLKISGNIYLTNEKHQNLVDTILDQIKISLIHREYEQMPLWGRT